MTVGNAGRFRLKRRGAAPARSTAPGRRVLLVAGHGERGGGEVMLLACADAVAASGCRPLVVAPASPGDLATAASELGHDVRTFPASPSAPWWRTALALRTTVRSALHEDGEGLVWCHGLRPAAATFGMRGRIVHIHRAPARGHLPFLMVAALGARRVLVPSASTRNALPRMLVGKAKVMGNWTAPLDQLGPGPTLSDRAPVIGFLGRIASEKGIDDLVAALGMLAEKPDCPPPR